MTEQQSAQIFNLRTQGLGYRTIASAVGLSRDSVRNHCKSRSMGGYGTAASKNVEQMKECGEICSLCGGPLAQPKTGRPKRFCSDKCRREWWKAHPDLVKHSQESSYELVCVRCETAFISYGNKSRKYCSHDCYIKHRFWEGEDGISKTKNQ